MLYARRDNIKIFSCNGNKKLADEIAKQLGTSLGLASVGTFSDGEICLRIDEKVRGEDVFIIQPTSTPVNDNLMELLIMIDAMRRSSAGRISAVMPYYGYARQDRKTRARDPISAKLVADLITAAGADRVLTMDLHCAQIQGFFNIPVDNLYGLPILAKYYLEKHKDLSDVVVASPDLGSVSRARTFAERIQASLAIIDKRRPSPNVSEVVNIIGDVDGKRVILFDDLIDTAGTLVNAATSLKERGATSIMAAATHGVLSGPALERLNNSVIEEVAVLNTIDISQEKISPKIKVLSTAPYFADAINRIHEELSVSKLFED